MQASRSRGAGQSVDALPVRVSACGSRNCRTGGPAAWVSQRPGFSRDRARLPLADLPRLPPGAWGLVFRDPCPLSGAGRAVVACPRGVAQGSTGMPPGGTTLPSFGGNGEGQELSTGVQSGSASQSSRDGRWLWGTGAQAGTAPRPSHLPSSVRLPPVRGMLRAAELLPELTGLNGALTAGVTRVLTGFPWQEGAERAQREWTRGGAGVSGVERGGEAGSTGAPPPWPPPHLPQVLSM